jgi:predicted acetyltransferase
VTNFRPADRADSAVLDQLLGLYMHDMSEWFGVLPGNEGDYGARCNTYFETNQLAYLAYEDGRPVGFAFVLTPSARSEIEHSEIEEFFVMRGYRARGVGSHFADYIWHQLPGNWVVRVLANNVPAVAFWRATISAFSGDATESRTEQEYLSDHLVPAGPSARTWIEFSLSTRASG